VLQCVVVRCSVLQCLSGLTNETYIVSCFNTLQRTATHCNTLQQTDETYIVSCFLFLLFCHVKSGAAHARLERFDKISEDVINELLDDDDPERDPRLHYPKVQINRTLSICNNLLRICRSLLWIYRALL